MDQHKANTALLTRSKFVHQTSTYRGGTTEYLNEIELRLPFVKIRKAWMNTEHGELS
ncbi:hypothetical protein QM806_04460 [Rhodococcus sp. IEGM 1351]|uniref:hypothetical protein n=1 Tax=Rhodococcus sp. IEGM 1351 TaxID=3047089 RepID=UPI0024B702DA|nr:hypothetical protein [Rhodococcus sp. IEGM 1351]MDI9934707.1 hypothetical protein [Rhodococcus sp. IEGM 1351]